jgi:catechol 2,3-dioxygenase-like lactoylglutathione lyase family enzyme
MSYAHLAIGSRDVQATSRFLCEVMQWTPIATPANAPVDVAWIDISTKRDRSQQIHIIHVADFTISPFDQEFGRHFAVFHDGQDMESVKKRVHAAGGTLIPAVRPTPFERFFFREPINGYVFEVIHRQQWIIEQ